MNSQYLKLSPKTTNFISNYSHEIELVKSTVTTFKEKFKISFFNSSSMEYCINYDHLINKTNISTEFENREKSKLRLKKIAKLKNNWNGYNAKPFSQTIINRCMQILKNIELGIEPKIFPTGRDSIQFEFEIIDNYLEFEIFEKKIHMLKVTSDSTKECLVTEEIIQNQILQFYNINGRKY